MDCQSGKGLPKFVGKSLGNILPSKCFECVGIDYATNLPKTDRGNTNLLVMMDLFSEFVILVPMGSITAEETAEVYLSHVFRRFGGQNVIRHDRDPRFMGQVFTKFSRMMKHRQRATLAYRPQVSSIFKDSWKIVQPTPHPYTN